VFHTVSDMIPQDFLFQTPQCGADRRNLSDDVNAVPILLDHATDTANLAFNPIQPFRARFLDVIPHAPYIPPGRMSFNTLLRRTGGRC
jgi:hypothetical protein